ncbi:MAG: hypothetical protein Q8N15_03875 [Bacillota bacterium]|nr:hypothetical protein [Bacillota bacterium]
MAYDDDKNDFPKVIDDDFLPFGAKPSPLVSNSLNRIFPDVPFGRPTENTADPEALAKRRKLVHDNVLFWSESKHALALAILITAGNAMGLWIAMRELAISEIDGFDRFSAYLDLIFSLVVNGLTIVGIWMICATHRLYGKWLSIGYRLMRYAVVLMAIQYGIAAAAAGFVGLLSLFANVFYAVFVIGILGGIFFVLFKFITQLLRFLHQLENAVDSKGYGHQPNPLSLSTFLFVFGGLALFASLMIPLFAGMVTDAVAAELLVPTIVAGVVQAAAYLVGGALIKRYNEDVTLSTRL